MIEDDPYVWLEDVGGGAASAWVAERNAETMEELTTVPGFEELVAGLRQVLDASDRIPYTFRRGEFLYNFWQDAEHVRGIWRRTTLEEYRKHEPRWELLLDLDVLADTEGEPWVWAGSRALYPDYRNALVLLSRDGADAVVVREFDLVTQTFVQDGFVLPEAKTSIGWIDVDHVFVGTDTGPGSMTASGYPRTVRRWRRGTPLSEAELVYEAAEEDLSTVGWREVTPGFERDFVSRALDFWSSELFYRRPDGELVKVDVPDDAGKTVHCEWLLVTPKTPWLGHGAGTLLAFSFDAFLAGDRTAQVLFTPDERSALVGHAWTRHHLVVESLCDVATRLEALTPSEGGWTRRPLTEVPPLSCAEITDTDRYASDEFFLEVTGYLQPPTLYRGELGGTTEVVKRAPARFAADGLAVRQHFAVSADGTRVPYVVVGPDTPNPDAAGHGPTLLYGYGGFRVSLTPAYSPITGRAWLERGGTYVAANIRGGGEYGPTWHQAALKAGRHRAFEDFAAVAKDLVDRGIATPDRLAAMGGSNGGLLAGAMLTQYPHLFGAIVAEVPLLDMLRFHHLLAGASWMAEYGNPDHEEDRPHLEQLSPYHQLRADAAYPPVLLTTSTRDDRVHPAHARKTAARLCELGHRVLFWENTSGGHAGAADHEQIALKNALVWTFLQQTLSSRCR